MSTGASDDDGGAGADATPVTLVTGGTSGIGEATARRLLQDGHRVCVTGRSKERLGALAQRLDAGNALLTTVADVSDYGQVSAAVSALAENTRLMVTADGIGVTLLAPGRVDTPFWDAGGGPPEGPILTPDDMAATIAWALGQPATIDINTIVVRPVGQRV